MCSSISRKPVDLLLDVHVVVTQIVFWFFYFLTFREDLTDYGAEVTSTKTLDPKDNMLDLFEILRARPATPGKKWWFFSFCEREYFAS